MLKVGLTGGIASGKTTVAEAFIRLKVPVVDADAVAREATLPGHPGLERLVSELGREILDAHGQLDRARLRQRLYADSVFRQRVEGILHPLILTRLQEFLAVQTTPYTVAVIPLLTENALAQTLVDRVLVLDCPESMQMERLMSRDGVSNASARAILAVQASRGQRLTLGDDILVNSGGMDELVSSVHELHGLYMAIAQHPTPAHLGTGPT